MHFMFLICFIFSIDRKFEDTSHKAMKKDKEQMQLVTKPYCIDVLTFGLLAYYFVEKVKLRNLYYNMEILYVSVCLSVTVVGVACKSVSQLSMGWHSAQ